MSKQIKLVAFMDLKAGTWQHVIAAVRQCVKESRKENGNIFYTVHKDNDHQDRIVFIECWEGDDAIAEHMNTDHFQNLVKVTEPYLEKPMQVLSLSELSQF